MPRNQPNPDPPNHVVVASTRRYSDPTDCLYVGIVAVWRRPNGIVVGIGTEQAPFAHVNLAPDQARELARAILDQVEGTTLT